MRLVQWLAYNPSTHVSAGAQDTQSLAGGESGVSSFLDSRDWGVVVRQKGALPDARGPRGTHTLLPPRARTRALSASLPPADERERLGSGVRTPYRTKLWFSFCFGGPGRGGAGRKKRGAKGKKRARWVSTLFPTPSFFACVVFQPLKAGGDLSGGRVTHTRSRAHTHRSGRKKGERVRGSGQCNEREKKKHPGQD